MANKQSKDPGLNTNIRPGSQDVLGFQPDLFPFDAWTFDDPNRVVAPKIRLKDPWALVVTGEDIEGEIDGGQIADGTIDNGQLADGAVNTPKLDQGNISIQSSNYDPGVAGWAIDAGGSAEFQDGIFRGTIQAADGNFSGNLDAASGNFGSFESELLVDTVVFPATTTEAVVYDYLEPLLLPKDGARLGTIGSLGASEIFTTELNEPAGFVFFRDEAGSLLFFIDEGSSSQIGAQLTLKVFSDSIVRGSLDVVYDLNVGNSGVGGDLNFVGSGAKITGKPALDADTTQTLFGHILTRRGTNGTSGQIVTSGDMFDALDDIIQGSNKVQLSLQEGSNYYTGVAFISGSVATFAYNGNEEFFTEGSATTTTFDWVWV